MTPALAELLHHHRRQIETLDKLIASLESGKFTTSTNHVDDSAESLARAQAQRADLQRLVDRHDPDGFTKLV